MGRRHVRIGEIWSKEIKSLKQVSTRRRDETIVAVAKGLVCRPKAL